MVGAVLVQLHTNIVYEIGVVKGPRGEAERRLSMACYACVKGKSKRAGGGAEHGSGKRQERGCETAAGSCVGPAVRYKDQPFNS